MDQHMNTVSSEEDPRLHIRAPGSLKSRCVEEGGPEVPGVSYPVQVCEACLSSFNKERQEPVIREVRSASILLVFCVIVVLYTLRSVTPY